MTANGDSLTIDQLDGMSEKQQAALARELFAQREQERARRELLNGVSVVFSKGFIKDKKTGKEDTSKPYANVTVSGNDFGGWRGMKFTPKSWAKLQSISTEIDRLMIEHKDEFLA